MNNLIVTNIQYLVLFSKQTYTGFVHENSRIISFEEPIVAVGGGHELCSILLEPSDSIFEISSIESRLNKAFISVKQNEIVNCELKSSYNLRITAFACGSGKKSQT